MGKKSKQKQQRRQQGSTQSTKPASVRVAPAVSQAQSAKVVEQPTATADVRPMITAIPEHYVRNDVKKVMILLVVMAVVLAGLVVTNQKSSYLKTAGKKLTSFMQL